MKQRARIQGWTAAQIAAAAGGVLARGDGAACGVEKVTTDSRQIEAGALFVALRGERFDGHDFAAQALRDGAAAVIVEDASCTAGVEAEGAAVIVVSDTLEALQRLGHAVWCAADGEGARTVALTGSNGKTTTKELLRALWSAHGSVYATHGNYNNHIGVPLTLANLDAEAQTIIVEMGANGPDDIRELTALAPGGVRLITSIGQAHLEGFGSLDGVRRTKGDIVRTASDADTVAIVPWCERGALVDDDFAGEVWTFGVEEGARVRVVAHEPGEVGTLVTLSWVGADGAQETIALDMPLFGAHNATNLAAAFTTLLASNVRLDDAAAQAALTALHLPGGRWRREEAGAFVFLDDAYNANPSSVRASFLAFMDWQRGVPTEGPRVAILGDMLELGATADEDHAQVARDVAQTEGLDALIAVGQWAGVMAEAAQEAVGGQEAACAVYAAADPEVAAGLLAEMGQGVVFLKASRGARLERVITHVTALSPST